jgi:hypothetical protein
MQKEVLVSIVTAGNPDWRKSVHDLKSFGVKRFALFTTMIPEPDTAMTILDEIKKQIPEAEIPFSHIHQKMTPEELDYMISAFKTKALNIHPTREYPLIHDYSKFYSMIYIENAGPAIRDGLKTSDVEGFAGVCIDVSHMENALRQNFSGHEITLETVRKFPVGANHVSAIYDKMDIGPVVKGPAGFDFHKFEKLENFDYLKNYGPEFFGPYIALEVYNTIEEQLKAKEYIEKIIL